MCRQTGGDPYCGWVMGSEVQEKDWGKVMEGHVPTQGEALILY